MNRIYYSEVDSKRFSLNVYRGVLQELDADYIRNEINKNKIDLLILRLPVETIESHHNLNHIDNWILADTLVYYYTSLNADDIKPLKNDLKFVKLSEENAAIIRGLVPVIFRDYKNHYFSNPDLDKTLITQGYIEWASSFNPENNFSWIVYKNDTPIGFATCNLQDGEAEGVLYGVHPDYSGGGVYSDIIRFTQRHFAEMGIKTMKVSTQIQNFAVQKVWAREGFILKHAFYTYHITPKNDTV